MYKQQTINSTNPITETTIQYVITDWVEAIHDFHQWNSKLANVIDEHILTNNLMNYLVKIDNQWEITDLIQLRFDVTNSLGRLLCGIKSMDEKADIALKVGQLISHTRTVRHWSEIIRDTLEKKSFGLS